MNGDFTLIANPVDRALMIGPAGADASTGLAGRTPQPQETAWDD